MFALLLYIKVLLVYQLYFSAGGMDLYAQKGKIKVTNTLESRLDLLSSQVTLRNCFANLMIIYF